MVGDGLGARVRVRVRVRVRIRARIRLKSIFDVMGFGIVGVNRMIYSYWKQ